MHERGEASESGRGFVHQALIYGSDEEFMDVALPFVKEGLRTGEPTLAAVQDRHVRNLQIALGGMPDGVTLDPVEGWYDTSARSRERFAQWVGEQTEGGGRARVIGEPPWALGHEAQIRDWARHESVVNVAFAGEPATFICPYDAEALPEEVLGHARATHPEIHSGEGTRASDSYVDPREFCDRLDSTVVAQRRRPELELRFGLEDLLSVRRSIGSFVEDAGLSRTHTEEFVLAVNEIATNAVVHGRPPTSLRAWHVDDEVVVEVTDGGDGIRNVLAGQLRPPADSLGGRGLWLTRLVCDAVEVCNAGGCIVTLHAAARSAQPVTCA
jgi:anti-sigma regulatory factor (Ser/Thr protein kinase)